MRLCRYEHRGRVHLGVFADDYVVPLAAGAAAYGDATHDRLQLPESDDLLAFLPPDGPGLAAALKLAAWLERSGKQVPSGVRVPTRDVQLLVPFPRPNKLLLLAGNYNEHLQEGGAAATERAETFPYVFMKPATTTLTDPGRPVQIPRVSPQGIDWEVELAVVIGRRARHVSELEALGCVAGYTAVNDISHRKFHPNPQRKKREKDAFFDWLHGKWFDSFCPCGPCVTSADAIPDPQTLGLTLSVNGETKQNSSTAKQVFPVAAVIAFISDICTLEPGDIISTGTPAGVGNATGVYLKPGDTVIASVDKIGQLTSPVIAEG